MREKSTLNSAEQRPAASGRRITAPHVLLVEGKDEELFFRALLNREMAQGGPGCQVIPLGKDRFRPRLLGLAADIRGRAVGAVGVVRDADDDAEGALQSVCDALAAAGFTRPAEHGVIVAGDPRVGVFIMPDGRQPGALEALCRRSVRASAAGLCVDEYMRCLTEQNGWEATTKGNTAQWDKAFVHAYLASRKNPVVRTGEGALQEVWDFGHEAFHPVTEFLRRLIGSPSGDAVPEHE